MVRRALVTGSASGIGWAIAQQLHERGVEVVGVDRAMHAAETPFESLQMDLRQTEACELLPGQVGPIDIVVNNAGVLVDKPLTDTTIDEMQLLFEVNLRAPIILTRAFLPGMQSRRWGRVINITSVGARTGGVVNSAFYCTTKAGLTSFTKFVARNYGRDGVTANAVAPGGIKTPMTEYLSEEQEREISAQIPIGHMAPPTTVAEAVEFFASDRSAFITGTTLDVNGGWVMA